MSIVKFAQSTIINLIRYGRHQKFGGNQAVSQQGNIMSQVKFFALLGVALLVSGSAHANKDAEGASADRNAIEIVTTAFGLEHLTQYSANHNALGVAWADHFGMEASYFDLGNSKFVKRRAGSSDLSENIGGRIDLKFALDLSARLSERSRVYSRVGVYLWDVDVNYNRVTNELDTSRGGNSSMLGVGAAYGQETMRFSVEVEQVNVNSLADNRPQQRLLLNVSSKF